MDILDMPILILGDLGNLAPEPVGPKSLFSFSSSSSFLPPLSISAKGLFAGLKALLSAPLTILTFTVHYKRLLFDLIARAFSSLFVGLDALLNALLTIPTFTVHHTQLLFNLFAHYNKLFFDLIARTVSSLFVNLKALPSAFFTISTFITHHTRLLLNFTAHHSKPPLDLTARASSFLLSHYYIYVHPTIASAAETAVDRVTEHVQTTTEEIRQWAWPCLAVAWVIVACCYAYKLYRGIQSGFDGRVRVNVHVNRRGWRVLCGLGRMYVGVPSGLFGFALCPVGDIAVPEGVRMGYGDYDDDGEDDEEEEEEEEEMEIKRKNRERRRVAFTILYRWFRGPILSLLSVSAVLVLQQQ
ncbi:hypothetical protein UCREL1_3560 [Eutypa lata UCREL1]|uniref:Uncharacterized protein n=1 Tax=Eutypa lata (strain UCR-EL1) TaxID=1287681 RepID=M7SXZ0_EUTLA|nr:hypothetical protein UCREL1_3560 [Eutypa lata UCREL1]